MILSKISKKESLGAIEISREAMDHLLRYDWPGNVRELENVLSARSTLRMRVKNQGEKICRSGLRAVWFRGQ